MCVTITCLFVYLFGHQPLLVKLDIYSARQAARASVPPDRISCRVVGLLAAVQQSQIISV